MPSACWPLLVTAGCAALPTTKPMRLAAAPTPNFSIARLTIPIPVANLSPPPDTGAQTNPSSDSSSSSGSSNTTTSTNGSGSGGGGGGGGGGGSAPGVPLPTDTPPVPQGTPSPPAQPPDCAPCEDGPRQGRVLEAEAPYGPLANVAIVAGAITVTSDADGTYTLPPPSTSAEVVSLSLPGKATSVLAGWRTGSLTTHLRATGEADNTALLGQVGAFPVSGRVVDAGGAPVANAQVVVTSAQGAYAEPGLSDADGRFSVAVVGDRTGNALGTTIWAFQARGENGVTALGVRLNQDLAAHTNLGDLAIAPPSGKATLSKPVTWPFPGTPVWSLVATTAAGDNLNLGTRRFGETEADVFTLPGVTFSVQAEASGNNGTAAFFSQTAESGQTVTPTLWAPPVPEFPLLRTPGSTWRWRPILEANTYRVSISASESLTDWEAFSPLPRFNLPASVPQVPARLRIVASNEGGLFNVAGLRALRLLAAPTAYSVWESDIP